MRSAEKATIEQVRSIPALGALKSSSMATGNSVALGLLVGLALLFGGAKASAQASQPPSPAPNASAAPACYPACRYGYVCYQGQCISACNPPCPPDQVCVDGTHCQYPAPPGGPPPMGPRIKEPPPPPKKSFAERVHGAVAFHFGFPGTLEIDNAENNLGSTFGANLRTDIPVAKYLLIGPLIQFGAWRQDVPNSPRDHSYYVDLALYVRGRYPVDLKSVKLQFWGGVPIGLTLSFLGGDPSWADYDGFSLGWNVGALFGGAVHFSKKFGLFTEFGFTQHKMSHDNPTGSTSLRLAQANWNFGVIFQN